MTDETNTSLEDLFGDGEESTKFEKEMMHQKAQKLSDQFLPISVELRKQLQSIKDQDENPPLETREVEMTLPPAAWEIIETISAIFEVFEDNAEVSGVPEDLRKAVEYSKRAYGGNTEQTMLSQAALENILFFADSMAKVCLARKLQNAASNPENLAKILKELEQNESGNKE